MKHSTAKNSKDLKAFTGKRPIFVDRKFDRKNMDYSSIKKKYSKNSLDPEYIFHEYDNIFNFLYKMPLLYTRVINEIDKIHDKYGYLAPIDLKIIAKNLNFPEVIIKDIIHTLRRKGMIFYYEHNIVRIHKIIRKYHILTMMVVRHPSVAENKGLGYKQLKNKTRVSKTQVSEK